ncbi:hypothetical protein, partial [Pseudoalteromonas sp. AC40-MNA-CIBAN-0181]|uniref:hypothetical protein n=1 Tax=Pseudoalteromonas sp. AC40-MNA-CIBAN-0181 TaxID=3140452 RepID=UPI003327D412
SALLSQPVNAHILAVVIINVLIKRLTIDVSSLLLDEHFIYQSFYNSAFYIRTILTAFSLLH